MQMQNMYLIMYRDVHNNKKHVTKSVQMCEYTYEKQHMATNNYREKL